MNNISQIYKNTIKNAIKEKIEGIADKVAEAIVGSICNCSNFNYASIMSSVQEKEREVIRMTLETTFEELDKTYRNSKDRFRYYVVQKSKIPRTITTIVGEITFRRCYYKCRLTGECHFILDELLGLPKGDKYDPVVKAYAMEIYTKTNQSLAGKIVGEEITTISNLLNNNSLYSIPRQSIHNWLHKWNVPDVDYEPRDTPETLYCLVDEKYLGCQDKDGDIMVKSFVVFEDVIPISKNRNKLKNRLVFNVQSNHPWVEFTDFLYKIYDASKIKNIYVLSDGGNWIVANLSELKVEPDITVKRLLCEFHFKQAINRITTIDEERKELLKTFKEYPLQAFNTLVDSYMKKYEHKVSTIVKQKNYINNNYKAIKDMLEFHIGSSMESHISHIVANPFASRPKGYSSVKIDKYLKINDYVNNSLNVFKLYLSSYITQEETTHSGEASASTNSVKYSDFVYRLPILDNKIDNTYRAIKGLTSSS